MFDAELRFVLRAGHTLGRVGRPASSFSEGQPIAGAFPAELWQLIEPLCRSALEGETRSRELWTADERHGLVIDIGPLRLELPASDTHGPATVAGGVAVVLDVSARRHPGAQSSHPREHL